MSPHCSGSSSAKALKHLAGLAVPPSGDQNGQQLTQAFPLSELRKLRFQEILRSPPQVSARNPPPTLALIR